MAVGLDFGFTTDLVGVASGEAGLVLGESRIIFLGTKEEAVMLEDVAGVMEEIVAGVEGGGVRASGSFP